MKLAMYQGHPTDGDIEGAFARIAALLASAAAAGARMLVLPELFLPGYNRPDLHGTLAQPLDGPWMTRVAALARAAGCGVTLGWAEREGDNVFNAATSFDATGRRIGHHRKIQLFGAMERDSFTPAPCAYPVFEVEGVPTGMLICYDVEFPGHAAALAAAGARMILVPTANGIEFELVQRVLVSARAYENRLVIAYANWCGSERGLAFSGQSFVVGPDARPLATAGDGEALLIVDLDSIARIPEAVLSTQARDWRGA
ncbi:carbon-nitrogen hydrolase family protein [Frigidibacter sp. MR17.14]|uniref:carbon-nitrogen hydrolase family protein n=1 Tax=Frigidibacter sp. MR17.14 TaxID=3126509 RepID=UPI003012A270